jgi:hypothetical protein
MRGLSASASVTDDESEVEIVDLKSVTGQRSVSSDSVSEVDSGRGVSVMYGGAEEPVDREPRLANGAVKEIIADIESRMEDGVKIGTQGEGVVEFQSEQKKDEKSTDEESMKIINSESYSENETVYDYLSLEPPSLEDHSIEITNVGVIAALKEPVGEEQDEIVAPFQSNLQEDENSTEDSMEIKNRANEAVLDDLSLDDHSVNSTCVEDEATINEHSSNIPLDTSETVDDSGSTMAEALANKTTMSEEEPYPIDNIHEENNVDESVQKKSIVDDELQDKCSGEVDEMADCQGDLKKDIVWLCGVGGANESTNTPSLTGEPLPQESQKKDGMPAESLKGHAAGSIWSDWYHA